MKSGMMWTSEICVKDNVFNVYNDSRSVFMENSYKFEEHELWTIVLGAFKTKFDIEIISLII